MMSYDRLELDELSERALRRLAEEDHPDGRYASRELRRRQERVAEREHVHRRWRQRQRRRLWLERLAIVAGIIAAYTVAVLLLLWMVNR